MPERWTTEVPARTTRLTMSISISPSRITGMIGRSAPVARRVMTTARASSSSGEKGIVRMSSTPRSNAFSFVRRSPRRVRPRTGVTLLRRVFEAPTRARNAVLSSWSMSTTASCGPHSCRIASAPARPPAARRSMTSARSWSTSARRASRTGAGALARPTVTALPRCVQTLRQASRLRPHRYSRHGRATRIYLGFLRRQCQSSRPHGVRAGYDRRDAKRSTMGAVEAVGSHLARLLPGADAGTVRRLERGAQLQAFGRRDVLHARGIPMPPFVVLAGHVMDRRVAETGQVRAALIAGPGYLGGLRAISDPDGEALYELVALTDGTWATWDPGFGRGLALEDSGLAVDLLDLSADRMAVLHMRLDERSFETARQRMAAILTTYGKVIFDTPHPVAQRADLAAMIGTSRVMMYRALREMEVDGLVKRERGGGIRILDAEGLAGLVTVAPPDGAPAL